MAEPSDPTLRVYPAGRPAADVAHRPGSGRVTADGLTEADVFAGIANGVPLASRRCQGDRHYPGPDVARLATGTLYTCRHCPAEFVIEDDGTQVPVGERSS